MLTDRVDLISDETVCFTVNCVHRFRAIDLYKAEDPALVPVHPIPQIGHAILALDFESRLVRPSKILGGNTAPFMWTSMKCRSCLPSWSPQVAEATVSERHRRVMSVTHLHLVTATKI